MLHHGIKSFGHGNVIWKFQIITGFGNSIKIHLDIFTDHQSCTITESYRGTCLKYLTQSNSSDKGNHLKVHNRVLLNTMCGSLQFLQRERTKESRFGSIGNLYGNTNLAADNYINLPFFPPHLVPKENERMCSATISRSKYCIQVKSWFIIKISFKYYFLFHL